jgi:hypothetical protein
MTAQHSMLTDEHGSPPEFVDLARYAMGGIDLDPASSPEWNRLVGAHRIITKKQNGLRTPWFDGAPAVLDLRTNPKRAPSDHVNGRVFLNSPSDKRGVKVAQFWFGIVELWQLGWVTAGVYVGFTVEQLSRLQRVGASTHPLAEVTLVPETRHDYRNTPTTLGEDAPHASFVTLLSRNRHEIERFAALGSKLGFVVNGDRRP